VIVDRRHVTDVRAVCFELVEPVLAGVVLALDVELIDAQVLGDRPVDAVVAGPWGLLLHARFVTAAHSILAKLTRMIPSINPDDFLRTPAGRVWTAERNRQAWRQAYAALEVALARSGERPQFYVVCGLQGSGKSTWIAQNGARLAPCVFFDAALPRAVHRAPLLEMGKQAGARICVVWIDASLEAALRRNAARPDDERVPESAVASVAEQFEPPTLAEGMHDIIHVQATLHLATRDAIGHPR
jgi:hypothetical protein